MDRKSANCHRMEMFLLIYCFIEAIKEYGHY